MDRSFSRSRRLLLVVGFGIANALGVVSGQAQELCGGVDYPFPYTDVSGVGAAFCPGIMEAYVTGVSKGTTPTTFSPNETVTRVQMTTFLQRSLDQGLTRTSRRAALNQWWTPQNDGAVQTLAFGGTPRFCAADGENIWLSNEGNIAQLQASTGKVQAVWTGAAQSWDILVADNYVFVEGNGTPGVLYFFDPTQPPGSVGVSSMPLPGGPSGIAFDGTNVWTSNFSGSVSIITPQSPFTVTTVTTGFTAPVGILYDGAHIWVTDNFAGKLFELDPAGAILNTVIVGTAPQRPVFDGANIWVPNYGDSSITVVQASTGKVVATITADGSNNLNGPIGASFDGERILVTNSNGSSVTLFKAADLSLIANVVLPSYIPYGTCSDGIHFWIGTVGLGANFLRF